MGLYISESNRIYEYQEKFEILLAHVKFDIQTKIFTGKKNSCNERRNKGKNSMEKKHVLFKVIPA